ncbi:hypothetical protein J5X84_38290 [Streptosporangiaceae bacterium NEAU-GS5]|nr:hypothetical protein [Streptosporangiaceae bacterium NEAU-GS5]
MITRIVSTLTAAVIAFSPGVPAATADSAAIAAQKADHVLIVGMQPEIAYKPTATTTAENRPSTERRRRRALRPAS